MSFLFFPQHKNARLNLHVDLSFVYYSPAQYTTKLAGMDSSSDKGRCGISDTQAKYTTVSLTSFGGLNWICFCVGWLHR